MALSQMVAFRELSNLTEVQKQLACYVLQHCKRCGLIWRVETD